MLHSVCHLDATVNQMILSTLKTEPFFEKNVNIKTLRLHYTFSDSGYWIAQKNLISYMQYNKQY